MNEGCAEDSVLCAEDESPVEVLRPQASSEFFLTCDHAGCRIPRNLGDLGLSEDDLNRHIAWDIGAAEVSYRLSEFLDATLVLQRYSRLVIDCNRRTQRADSIPEISDGTPIPGNIGLTQSARAARCREIFAPYHQTISDLLDARSAAGKRTAFVAIHSCTPVFESVFRPWHVGVLYNEDDLLAHEVMKQLRAEDALIVGENEPYFFDHARDYSTPVHAEQRGFLHFALEIRQDLITHREGQIEWAERLAKAIAKAGRALDIHT